MEKKQVNIFAVLFGIYCAVMFFLRFNRAGAFEGVDYWEQVSMSCSLTPFHTIRQYLRLWNLNPQLHRLAVINLVGNVVMFIPPGTLLPLVFRRLRSFWKTMLCTTGIIIAVELTQLFTLLGSCDIDDLILNLLGASIGYFFYRLFLKRST